MLKWFYWKNDKNRYKIYGKNDKTIEKRHESASLLLTIEIDSSCGCLYNLHFIILFAHTPQKSAPTPK